MLTGVKGALPSAGVGGPMATFSVLIGSTVVPAVVATESRGVVAAVHTHGPGIHVGTVWVTGRDNEGCMVEVDNYG